MPNIDTHEPDAVEIDIDETLDLVEMRERVRDFVAENGTSITALANDQIDRSIDAHAAIINIAQSIQNRMVEQGHEDFKHIDLSVLTTELLEIFRPSETATSDEVLQNMVFHFEAEDIEGDDSFRNGVMEG